MEVPRLKIFSSLIAPKNMALQITYYNPRVCHLIVPYCIVCSLYKEIMYIIKYGILIYCFHAYSLINFWFYD